MKKTARILAVLMAILLSIATMIPAMAEPNDNNQPTPSGVDGGLPYDKGSLTITKYLMNDLDLAGDPNDGGEIGDSGAQGNKNAGAIIPPSPDAETLADVKFDIYKIDFSSYIDQDGFTTHNTTNAPLDHIFRSLLDDFNKMGFIMVDNSGNLAYENPTFIESAQRNPDVPTEGYKFPVSHLTTVTTGSDGSVTESNMDKGFYLVVEQLGNDKVASVSFPFIVAIPMTNPAGDGWIQHVYAYPKNGDLTIEKEIDRNSVHVGEEVNFTVTVSVPSDIRTYNKFFMTDTLDDALDYKVGSMKVYGLLNETDPSIAANEIKATGAIGDNGGATVAHDNWTLTYGTHPDPAKSALTNVLAVNFTKKASTAGTPGPFGTPVSWNESREIDGDGFWTLRQYKYVRFEFTCHVNDKILARAGTDISQAANAPSGDYPAADQSFAYTLLNEAEINFLNKFEAESGKEPRTRKSKLVRTHSAALVLAKVDANTKEVLVGAEFKIASSKQNAIAGKFMKKVTTAFTVDGVNYKVGAILDPGNSIDAVVLGDTAADGKTADWVETSAIPTAADLANYYKKDPALEAYVTGKAVVRFEGLKDFGNWSAKKGTTVDGEDLEDVRKENFEIPAANTSSKYMTYWVVETQAPPSAAGKQDYNLLLEPIEVEFTRANGTFANWYTRDGGTIHNTNKFTLPKTGGIGTILYTAGGIALITVAGFLFLMSARKKKANEM